MPHFRQAQPLAVGQAQFGGVRKPGFMKLVQMLSGIGMVVGGALLLVAWYREQQHSDQKTLGVAFIVIGCLTALSALV